jgi:hypothetical protein
MNSLRFEAALLPINTAKKRDLIVGFLRREWLGLRSEIARLP